MTETIVVLIETALNEADVANLTALHPDREVKFHVLAPAELDRNFISDFIDRLALFENPRDDDDRAHHSDAQHAQADLDASLKLLTQSQVDADGEVVEGPPVDALIEKVKEIGAYEAVVVTIPHAVEDTFRTDWATKAQDALGLPVLHLYSGSGFIGDS